MAALHRISRWSGFPVKDVITALGMEWALSGKKCEYKKEHQRLYEAKDRLARIGLLSLPMHMIYSTVTAACLAMTDYSGLPSSTLPASLSVPIKKCVGSPAAAPEIILNLGGPSSVDPVIRWIMSIVKVWRMMAKMSDGREVLARIEPSSKNSRLSSVKKMLGKRGFEIDETKVYSPFRNIEMTKPWNDFRTHLMMDLERKAWLDLEKRRPSLYRGLDLIDVRSHSRLLKKLSSYRCAVLLRVWVGCPMTLSHRHTQLTKVWMRGVRVGGGFRI